MSANLPAEPWSFERCSGRIRDAHGVCIAQIFAEDDQQINALVARLTRPNASMAGQLADECRSAFDGNDIVRMRLALRKAHDVLRSVAKD
jgi:hypothetical protein